jgi:Trypsin
MRRLLITPILAAMLLLGVLVTPSAAVTGGQPDGNGHPYGALLLAPGLTFCSGSLISEDTILTAGHCTDFWDVLADEEGLETIMVSFDSQASVDENWEPDGGTWYEASNWLTHPDYVEADWPFTYDYGLLYLDDPVGITPADLPSANALTPIVGGKGQTNVRFDDVGYGIQGTIVGGGPPLRAITWTRKVATQRYSPGNGSVNGLFHPTWFIVNNVPSPRHGGTCGGDSGSPLLFSETDTVVAVHTGGYRLGYNGVLCGRITSLNHRIDLPDVLRWITDND